MEKLFREKCLAEKFHRGDFQRGSYVAERNYLAANVRGQLSRWKLFMGNCPGCKNLLVIVLEAILRGQLSGTQLSMRELVRGNCSGSKSLGSNCPEENIMGRWAIVRVAVVQEGNVWIPSYLYNLFFIIILIKSDNINLR